jgi:hypothetical protein
LEIPNIRQQACDFYTAKRTLNAKCSDGLPSLVMASQQQPPFAYPTNSDYVQPESSQSQNQSVTQVPLSQSRQAAEEARKDRTLAEFLLMLDDYEPLVCLFLILGFICFNGTLDSE